MSNFEKFKKQLPSKESSLTNKKVGEKKLVHVINVWNKFEMKMMKDYHDLYLKSEVLLLTDVFKNLEIIALKIMDYVQVII